MDSKKLLLTNEPVIMFTNKLAVLYGETGALLLSQLHYVQNQPFYNGEPLPVKEQEGFKWVRLENYMWHDRLDGFLSYLSLTTFQRVRDQLTQAKVLLTSRTLEGDGLNPHLATGRWYAIDYKQLEKDSEALNAKLDAEREERAKANPNP